MSRLTDECLISDEVHPQQHSHLDWGRQRRYDLANGYGLSLVDGPALHGYPFAWEAAILKNGQIVYDTPFTDDVLVFMSDEETNDFIHTAIAWAKEQT